VRLAVIGGYSLDMPYVSVIAAWLAMAGLGAVTLWVAVLAGRSRHDWQRAPLLIVELCLLGTVLVSWMLEVWFVAKVLIAAGLGASVALVVAIAGGIALLGLAGGAGALLLLAAYSAKGSRARFVPDLRNSLWLSKSHTWRPSDF
jgi:hypothetical protein